MDTKSIAFLCHPYHRGGVTRWMAQAAIAYSKLGYEVYFATPEPLVEFRSARGREAMVQLFRNEPNTVKVITAGVGRSFEFGTPAFRTHQYKVLLSKVPKGVPVIISDDAAVWEAACALKASNPVVAVLHADDAAYYQLAARYKKDISIFVSVSARVDRTFKQKCPEIDAATAFVIPCDIVLPKVAPAAQPPAVYEILYVGRIENIQKRAEDLLKIATVLKNKGVSFHLKIIGDGLEVRQRMEQAVGPLGLTGMVTFTGWLSQEMVLQTMATAHLLLLTSNYEGTPVSMMEALACGCGFVGTRVSGIEDYEHHPKAVDCFRVFDIGAIDDAAAKIESILAIPVEQRRSAARSLAEEQFSMPTCLGRYNKAIAAIKPGNYTAASVSIGLGEVIKSKVLAYVRYLKVSLKK